MILIDILTGLTVLAYICRLDGIQATRHRPAVVLVHALGAIVSALACGHAVLGDVVGVGPAVYVGWAAAVLWLGLTLRQYRHGPPADALQSRFVEHQR